MSDLIYPGAIVRITNGDGFKTKPAGTLFDPNDVELTLRAPDGSVTDLSSTVVTDGTGLWHADYTVATGADGVGRHWFKWNGDEVINEGYFDVVRDRTADPINDD